MSAPDRIDGLAVRMWKLRNAGVMRSRLAVSEKNANTSGRGLGSHCQVASS
jgi:hypothetical protein